MYLAGLKRGRIQDQPFEYKPRLINTGDAMQTAFSEWSRLQHKERLLFEIKSVAASHEPMEIDALTSREALAEKDKTINKLQH